MKNIFLHYIFLMLPFVGVIRYIKYFDIPLIAIGLILIWSLVYAPFLTGRRLFVKGLIPKMRPVSLTFYDWDLYKEVYFKK